MGMFSKLKCNECGEESRFIVSKFRDGYAERCLCDDCLRKLHATGFVKYKKMTGIEVLDYQHLCQYRDAYERIVTNPDYSYELMNVKQATNSDIEQRLAFELGDLVINRNFITISSMEDLIIETKDVFAITINEAFAFKGPLASCSRITFFTNNPLVPYFSTVAYTETSVFPKKNKKMKEDLIYVLVDYCKNVKYAVVGALDLKEIITRDPNYSAKINKGYMLQLLDKNITGIGYFNDDRLYELVCKEGQWGLTLNIMLGYFH